MLSFPLLDDTRGLVGTDEFERMPEAACLINVSRLEVVDEAALVEAL